MPIIDVTRFSPQSQESWLSGRYVLLGIVLLALSGCRAAPPGEVTPTVSQAGAAVTATRPSSPSPTAPEPSATSARPIGPGYLPGFNPLTGLPVQDAASLQEAPLLISITNFPVSARPQSGLSLASNVWEVSIGQGMSRFLAVYYGDYLTQLKDILQDHPTENAYGYVIAPIRSGRVVYEGIKDFFPDAVMVTRGASREVRPLLTGRIGVYAANREDVNSAGLTLEELEALPRIPIDPAEHAALVFDPAVPPGGVSGVTLRLVYNRYDIVEWAYDAASGRYLRSQDQADDTGILVPATDRLTGQQLAFDNILVLFTRHNFVNPEGTIMEIALQNQRDADGLLFRDGRRYVIAWSTPGGRLELRDPLGQLFPLRPGQTFFEVVGLESSWDQVAGIVRFHNPPIPTRTPAPTATRTRMPTPTETPEPADTPEPTAEPPTEPPPEPTTEGG